jgi:tetratricopeptide (TPR) repeat protein
MPRDIAADTLREMGRFTEALASYAQALSLMPDYTAALNNRAKTLCEMNLISEGFRDFLRSAELVYGAVGTGSNCSQKIGHDQAQRLYLSNLGEELGDGLHLSGGE